MPRKKPANQPAPATATPENSPSPAGKKWAEPYRPLATNAEAGFEMGENKLTGQMMFYFGEDPGAAVKARLKHYGYFYHADQKVWTVNATPLTREIAQRLAEEFGGGKKIAR